MEKKGTEASQAKPLDGLRRNFLTAIKREDSFVRREQFSDFVLEETTSSEEDGDELFSESEESRAKEK